MARSSTKTKLSVAQCFVKVMSQQLNHLTLAETQANSWHTPEGVHQLRVSLRRMRSILSAFRGLIVEEWRLSWQVRCAELAKQLAPARECDVLMQTLVLLQNKVPIGDAQPLLAVVAQQRQYAYQQVGVLLNSEQYQQFKSELQQQIHSQVWLNQQSPVSKMLLSEYAQHVLRAQSKALIKAIKHTQATDMVQLHQLRIRCKKLRYSAEALHSKQLKLLKRLATLQDLLGQVHDIQVMQHHVLTLIEQQQNTSLVLFAGAVLGWQTSQIDNLQHLIMPLLDKLQQQNLSHYAA